MPEDKPSSNHDPVEAGPDVEMQAARDILGHNPFRKLIEELKDFSIFLTDTQGHIVSWNEGARRLFGYEQSEVLGEHFSLVFTPEDIADGVPEQELATARAEGRAEDCRWHQCKDGTRFFCNGLTTALHDDDGALKGFAKIARDETPRRLAEEQLQDARTRLEAALAVGNIGTWIWDIKNDRVFADENLAAIFSVSPQDASGGPIGHYLSAIHEDDLERVSAVIQRALQTGEPYAADYRVVQADGVTLWVEARGQVQADADGEAAFLPGVLFDITARKKAEDAAHESERQFRILADSIPQLAWMAEADGYISWYNRRWYEYTGTDFESMQGWGWKSVHHPDEVERVTERFKKSVESGEPWEDTFPLRGKDGMFRWFLSRAMPIHDAQGRIVRWFGTNTDIEEWRRARQTAEEANRLKDEFLATLSHELRTPLHAILGWASLLRTKRLDEATAEQGLESIERNARTQNQLIEDILDVSRIITGKIRLDLQQMDLASAIEGAIDSVRPAAEAKEIRLTIDLMPRAGLISGDAARLQQIIWNLLSNAIKFTPKGGQVKVALERAQSSAQLTVTDNGQGIAPQFLPHVFDRFRQADSSSTRHYGGLGLGLSIVRQLVELHGGTIEVESPGEGLGATFRVRFPLAAIVVTKENAQAESENISESTSADELAEAMKAATEFPCPTDLKDLHVLVVDDEPDARLLLSTMLKNCGALVQAAASVAEAMKIIESETIEVIVSDVGMPQEDGYALMQKVRAFFTERGQLPPPAIALTAFARSEDRVRALRAGFHTHVSKPVEPTELVAVVATLGKKQEPA